MIFLIFFLKMGFRENLKAQLKYSDMLVKELAAKSGLKKQRIDSYLRKDGYEPSAETAVKIAQALGLSVEYLVTGREIHYIRQERLNLPFDVKNINQDLFKLNVKDRKVVSAVIQSLIERNRDD
jgi:transcriptional regulator with XRE-family HTH domain